MKSMKLALSVLTSLLSLNIYADLEVRFIEGAPKDTFIINNTSTCIIDPFLIDIDLSKSAGKLIFDTTSSGVGVEVFQPFEKRSGNFSLKQEQVQDGNTTLSLLIDHLEPQQNVSFTIDVDDQLAVSELGQIRISGSELKGGIAKVTLSDESVFTGTFHTNNRLLVELPTCA